MKSFSVIVFALSLLLIVLTSPPPSHPGSPGDHRTASWVNPNGTRGPLSNAAEPAAPSRREYAWTNPDGVRGTERGHSGGSLAKGSSWVNPDGAAGKISPVHARADGANTTF